MAADCEVLLMKGQVFAVFGITGEVNCVRTRDDGGLGDVPPIQPVGGNGGPVAVPLPSGVVAVHDGAK